MSERAAQRFLIAGAALMALATIVGAVGTHALRPHLSPDRFEILQTAVHYQFFQALGLMAIGLIAERRPARCINMAGWLVLIGVVLFSGSLYLLLAGAPRLVGVLTPVGGASLIAGWICLALGLYFTRNNAKV
jgi:uncharacterized membrane protein YgdD (TMEM256/DUF423 family)